MRVEGGGLRAEGRSGLNQVMATGAVQAPALLSPSKPSSDIVQAVSDTLDV